ncbi:amidinotransferase [Thalassotalea sp. M1531]|uniref:Amidinotransferase n=2 Tax=Thalassotalea algicola TaxID=2716224 RepID=A0A7Y0LCA4_9GAMM|nr:amidinotransferase [Thalassotalea algicola]
MVRPHHFSPNVETASDNAFQVSNIADLDKNLVSSNAYKEVTQVANKLASLGVTVHLFEDKTGDTPDSVFPNNWFTAHPNGNLCLYPMYAKNRRLERRNDIIEMLQERYKVNSIVDLTGWESREEYLEGTGVMVFDYEQRAAYVSRSNRATERALQDFCQKLNVRPVLFSAYDKSGVEVYHTNVLMCVTSDFVIIADEMIKNDDERQMILDTIKKSGKKHVSLTELQISQFAGNMLELSGNSGRFIAVSETAYNALNHTQMKIITEKVPLIPFAIPTIELAGGSIRCMLAGIHLPVKNASKAG